MVLAIPSLDDRTYADLLDEAMDLIPAFDASWTDYNPSDPGVTLLELFAWLVELLIYSLDRPTAAQRLTFLRLLNGPDWKGEPPEGPSQAAWLDGQTERALDSIRERYRAVTVDDFEALARKADARVKRVRCLPETRPGAAIGGAPGHVSLIIVEDGPGTGAPPAEPARGQPGAGRDAREAAASLPSADLSDDLVRKVEAFFGPRLLLTAKLHVVPASMVPVTMRVAVVASSDHLRGDVRRAVGDALERWLDPLEGGAEGKGWPFSRPVFASEIHRVVEAVPGVDHVVQVFLRRGAASDETADPHRGTISNGRGESIGVEIGPAELPVARHDVRCATAVMTASIDVSIALSPGQPRDGPARRAVAAALEDAVWAFDGPAPFDEGTVRDALPRGGVGWVLGRIAVSPPTEGGFAAGSSLDATLGIATMDVPA